MTLPILISLSVSILALVCSLFAVLAWRRSSTRQLSMQLSELSQSQEALNLQMRSVKVRLSALSRPRKNGKFGASDDQDATGDKAPTDAAEWKRKMNLQLALGKVKP